MEEGFSQAKGILSGIGDISGGVAEDIDATFNLVMEGIDAFGEEEEEESPLDAPVPPPEVIDADDNGLLAI